MNYFDNVIDNYDFLEDYKAASRCFQIKIEGKINISLTEEDSDFDKIQNILCNAFKSVFEIYSEKNDFFRPQFFIMADGTSAGIKIAMREKSWEVTK